MSALQTNQRRLLSIAALIAAILLGFVLAKMTTKSPATAAAMPPEASPNAGTVTSLDVDQSHLAAVGIELQTVTAGNLSAEIRAPASVTPAPDAQAVVTAHASGTVVSIQRHLGDSVHAGEVLARVESREAAAIASDRDVAISKASLARSILQREKGLYEQHVTPRQDYEAAQAQLVAAESEERRARAAAVSAHVASDGRSIEIVSPIAGRITSVDARLGSFTQSDTELFRIADPKHIQFEAAVTASDAARIARGDHALIVSGSREPIVAVVQSVAASINEATRSATVVLSIADDAQGASTGSTKVMPAPGEFVQAIITPHTASSAGFVVPEDAVQRIDGRDVVFVRTDKGFRVQPVVVGSHSAGRSLVLSGLKAGQTIATRNAFFLKAEIGKGAEEDEE